MFEEEQLQIQKAAEQLACEVNAEIFEVTLRRVRQDVAVVVIADLEFGGISLDQCTYINQKLVEYIDQNMILVDDYTLEVNSPGLDSPLKTWRDFHRVTGRLVHFYLKEKIEGKLEHIGKILMVNEEEARVFKNKTEFQIPLQLINKAYQVIS